MVNINHMPPGPAVFVCCLACDDYIVVPEGFFHCETCKSNSHYTCNQNNISQAKKIMMENKHVLRKKGNRHKEKRRIPKNDLTVCQENSIEESVGSKREELPEEKKVP